MEAFEGFFIIEVIELTFQGDLEIYIFDQCFV